MNIGYWAFTIIGWMFFGLGVLMFFVPFFEIRGRSFDREASFKTMLTYLPLAVLLLVMRHWI